MKITHNNVTQNVSEFIINNKDVIDPKEMLTLVFPMTPTTDLLLCLVKLMINSFEQLPLLKHTLRVQKEMTFLVDLAKNGDEEDKELYAEVLLSNVKNHIDNEEDNTSDVILNQLLDYHLTSESGEVYDWGI